MIKCLLVLVTIANFSQPLGLDWSRVYKKNAILSIPGYQYYYGDISWGRIVLLGKEDIIGLESEIHLDLSRGKLSSATLILGPAGLNDYNCIKKYKSLISLLDNKYGHHKIINEIRDPMIDDIVSSTVCYPMKVGLREIKTFWKTGNYGIEAVLFGDEEGYYIEITYVNLFLENEANKLNRKRILKKL